LAQKRNPEKRLEPRKKLLCEIMSPIEDIKRRLEKYPKVVFEEKENYICLLSASEAGFDVWFSENEREYTVGFSSWHEHFDKDELENALNCFSWGLSDSCRVKTYSRKGEQYKWQVQSLENEEWVTFSTTARFDFSFLIKPEIEYKINRLIKS